MEENEEVEEASPQPEEEEEEKGDEEQLISTNHEGSAYIHVQCTYSTNIYCTYIHYTHTCIYITKHILKLEIVFVQYP